jgi:hypothetical protein
MEHTMTNQQTTNTATIEATTPPDGAHVDSTNPRRRLPRRVWIPLLVLLVLVSSIASNLGWFAFIDPDDQLDAVVTAMVQHTLVEPFEHVDSFLDGLPW